MKFLLAVVALALCLAYCSATSDANPSLITVCDAMSDRYGCDPAQWTGGNRLRCTNTSKLMSWASKTVRSDCYSVFAGEEATPLTTYPPGGYIKINIEVNCFRMLYRGLLIYAVNSANVKVGDWYLPNENPALFRQPWVLLSGHACEKSLMHDSAALKPYHAVVHFKAPPVGTGRITFRTLIKQGIANTGAFYWPQTDLTLNEGTPAAGINWEKTAIGQSCSEYCATKSLVCNANALNNLRSAAAMDAQLTPKFTCKFPLLSGCKTEGGSFEPATELCYYLEPNCTGQGRVAPPANLCTSKNAEFAKFCACRAPVPTSAGVATSDETSAGVPTDGLPTDGMTTSPNGNSASLQNSGGATTEFVGAANSLKTPLFSIAVLVSFLCGANTRTLTLLMLVFGIASGHNWINSFSRSPGASTVPPCKPALTDLPHAQVGPNQPFQIEWMNGHGGPTYFVILNAKNADKMILHTVTLLEDYIRNAPNTTVNRASDPKYCKYHRKETQGTTNDYSNLTGLFPQLNYFAAQIFPNDTRWIARSPYFKGRNHQYMFSYKPAQLATDVVISYKSAKYPWIEAVHKYQITTMNPGRFDVANFYIPGYGGFGRYIAQYYWNGYRDCVDVDYKPAAVANIYGYPSTSIQWKRIDHCFFDNFQDVRDYAEVVTDPKYCMDRCQARGAGCFGVSVVPLRAPADVKKGLKPTPNDRWAYPAIYGTDMYVPWVNALFNSTRNTLIANYTSKYLCYTVLPQAVTDVAEEFVVTADPKDPYFYSTCYYKLIGNMFDDYLNYTSPTVDVNWRFVDKCIDCKTKALNSYRDVTPKWSTATTCVNCDREPATVAKPTVNPFMIENGTVCDGYAGFSSPNHTSCAAGVSCTKQLFPLKMPANQDAFLADCFQMAAQDPECSGIVMHQAGTAPRCHCYKNLACCKTCSRKSNAAFATYELKTTADPTCATGTRNGKACCSGSCGAGKCLPGVVTAIQAPVGFCNNGTITRSCTTFGPPCMMP